MGAPTIASVILKAPELSEPLQLAAPALFFSSVAGGLNGTIAGLECFDRLAKQGWLASLVTFVAVLVGVTIASLRGAAVGLAVGEAARMALAAHGASSVLKSRKLPLFAGTGLSEAKVLWTFSLPTVISGALHVPVFWSCQAIIAGGPNGLSQVGIYDAAQKWMTLVIFVPTAASAIVASVLSNLSADYASHRSTTLRVAAAQIAACASACSGRPARTLRDERLWKSIHRWGRHIGHRDGARPDNHGDTVGMELASQSRARLGILCDLAALGCARPRLDAALAGSWCIWIRLGYARCLCRNARCLSHCSLKGLALVTSRESVASRNGRLTRS